MPRPPFACFRGPRRSALIQQFRDYLRFIRLQNAPVLRKIFCLRERNHRFVHSLFMNEYAFSVILRDKYGEKVCNACDGGKT